MLKRPADQTVSSKKGAPLVEDFSRVLDLDDNWQPLNRAWGGANGRELKENVYLENGVLILEAHGDLYAGGQQGVQKMENQSGITILKIQNVDSRGHTGSGVV